MRLTIGMATYGDFEGVYFTVQSLRAHHDLTDCEILVIDNEDNKKLKDWVEYWGRGIVRYVLRKDVVGTSFPRDQVFRKAKGQYVICIDSHVLLLPGALDRPPPPGDDLHHGPMCYDNFTYVTHMRDKWNANMWGVWGPVENELPNEPFEIPMHGLGLFACWKDAWLGFNPEFRGFGGEEGYIHRKYQLAGRKVLCLPWMKWLHRFDRKIVYPLNVADRVRNYLLGFRELGLDPRPIYDHFGYQMVKKIESTIDR